MPRLVGAGILASGLLMLLYALVQNAPHLSVCARLSRSFAVARLPFLLGFLVGVNLCPPFMAGLLRLLTLSSVSGCVAYFAAFFVGTTVYMLPLAASAPLARSQRLRAVAAIASAFSGVWFVGLGLSRL